MKYSKFVLWVFVALMPSACHNGQEPLDDEGFDTGSDTVEQIDTEEPQIGIMDVEEEFCIQVVDCEPEYWVAATGVPHGQCSNYIYNSYETGISSCPNFNIENGLACIEWYQASSCEEIFDNEPLESCKNLCD